MDMHTEVTIRNLADDYLAKWRLEHHAELRKMGWSAADETENKAKAECMARAKREILEAEAAQTAAVIAQIWNNPLTPEVTAFYAEEAERERLTAERDAQIAATKAKYAELIPRPGAHITAYNEGRVALLLERVAAAGLELCFDCGEAKPDVEMVVIDGQGQFGVSDCSYDDRTWTEQYLRPKRLCGDCRQRENKPVTPQQLRQNPDISYQFVRPAEERVDGLYANYDGEWRALPKDTTLLQRDYQSPGGIRARLAEQWDLPPELALYGSQLTIYRRYRNNVPLPQPMLEV